MRWLRAAATCAALALVACAQEEGAEAGNAGGEAAEAQGGAAGREVNTVFIEEMTWTEIRDALDAGKTTVIVPTAGTEQNGPHMVMGKHRYIIDEASDRIARELGNALVAPSVTYVPGGQCRSAFGAHAATPEPSLFRTSIL